MFAHTTVDAPKNGAINRAAAISAPNVDTPTTNTNTSKGGRPALPGRGSAVPGAPASVRGAATGGVLDDRLVDEPLHGRAVVRVDLAAAQPGPEARGAGRGEEA